jgi:hypothetical protein
MNRGGFVRQEDEHLVAGLERLRGSLVVTTVGCTAAFAVRTIFVIIGVEIQRLYGLSDTEFGPLIGDAFLHLAAAPV